MEKIYIAMFSDGCYEDYREVALFASADEQMVKEFTEKAEEEYKQALEVKMGTWDIGDRDRWARDAEYRAKVVEKMYAVRNEYKEAISKILLTDSSQISDFELDSDGRYFYQEVEVR